MGGDGTAADDAGFDFGVTDELRPLRRHSTCRTAEGPANQGVYAVPRREPVGGGLQACVDGAPDHEFDPSRGHGRVERPLALAAFDLDEYEFVYR